MAPYLWAHVTQFLHIAGPKTSPFSLCSLSLVLLLCTTTKGLAHNHLVGAGGAAVTALKLSPLQAKQALAPQPFFTEQVILPLSILVAPLLTCSC